MSPSDDGSAAAPPSEAPTGDDDQARSDPTVGPGAGRDGRGDRHRGVAAAGAWASTTTVDPAAPAGTADDVRPAGGTGDAGRVGDDPREPNGAGGTVGEEPDGQPEEQPRKPRSRARTIVEWALVIGGALLVALVVRSTLAQAFWIPSPSMEPTLHEGDRVLVNKVSYRLHDVHRGDIIVFERPDTAIGGDDGISDLIKRVIGLPGDIIESRPDGNVYVNGRRLDEPYLTEGTRTTGLERQEVPEGHVFVMGDNRDNSSDSRAFGPVDEDLIIGRAFIRIWPLGDVGGL